MSREQVKLVLRRASLNSKFRALVMKQPDKALGGYDLTAEEFKRLASGKLDLHDWPGDYANLFEGIENPPSTMGYGGGPGAGKADMHDFSFGKDLAVDNYPAQNLTAGGGSDIANEEPDLSHEGQEQENLWPDKKQFKPHARTASSDPEWKYINVRRYFAYLEHSIDKGTKWAVFGGGLLLFLLLGLGLIALIVSGWGDPTTAIDPTAEPSVSTDEPAVTTGGQSACGDDKCNPKIENSDICPKDCHCTDDGVCSPGEGLGCLDCSYKAGSCRASCSQSSQCGEGLSCADGICWDACICGGDCSGGTTGGGGTCPCKRTCVAYNAVGTCLHFEYLDCKGNTCRP